LRGEKSQFDVYADGTLVFSKHGCAGAPSQVRCSGCSAASRTSHVAADVFGG
jgi:hypothetical protein